jgi:predicted deacylase
MFFANTDYFSPTYAVARDKFRAAASGAGADLHVYDYDRSPGIEEERLSIDVACLGSATSRHKLVVISGTHGTEGYAGSALQTAWLRLCASRRELDHIGVILVHALNPYGFSYGVRTNEDGIDLNRNFVDFSRGRPENRIYDEVHRFLNADIADADRCSHAEAGRFLTRSHAASTRTRTACSSEARGGHGKTIRCKELCRRIFYRRRRWR